MTTRCRNVRGQRQRIVGVAMVLFVVSLLVASCSSTSDDGAPTLISADGGAPEDDVASGTGDVLSVDDAGADGGESDVSGSTDVADTLQDASQSDDIAETPDTTGVGDTGVAEDVPTPEDTTATADAGQLDVAGPDDTFDEADTGGGADVATTEDVDEADVSSPDTFVVPTTADLNGDGTLAVLVIGTSTSLAPGAPGFSATSVAAELEAILAADGSTDLETVVSVENIYANTVITTGYGQAANNYDWTYHRHSLTQWYYWPDGLEERMEMLLGDGGTDWDAVVIAADPYIVETVPGYFALGVNKVAAKVAAGGAQPLLLMGWHPAGDANEPVSHVAEVTYRVGREASVDLPVLPAALAWVGLPAGKVDTSSAHPTPNGAYLAAATIYSHLFGVSASWSGYSYDDDLADAALSVLETEGTSVDYGEAFAFMSPFSGAGLSDRVLNYNHTGTSSENGILKGLQWIVGKANVQLVKNGTPPINFNYGRANTEFEPNKRYKIDPEQFEVSLGFPMQDHSNNGNVSMFYGLDKRRYDLENGTDLGVARYMVANGELPHARAVPIRTLLAQMREVIPGQSGYSDGWHMNKDLDKATGAYMYTLLTGHCALDAEPADETSADWKSWVAHKTGYETAWTLMHLRGRAPCLRVLPENAGSTTVSADADTTLAVSFGLPPTADVTVTITVDNGAAAQISPSTLTFTSENYAQAQMVTLSGLGGVTADTAVIVTATATSEDAAFDDVIDRWTYTVTAP